MENQIVCEKEVELLEDKYVVYLKRVASKVAPGGVPVSMCLRAFVKKSRGVKTSNGGIAVTPGGMGHEYELPAVGYIKPLLPDSAIGRPVIGQQKSVALAECLLSAARELLGREGINIPYATLEFTRGGEVVMHGVPNSGQLLVCAQTERRIQNYLY